MNASRLIPLSDAQLLAGISEHEEQQDSLPSGGGPATPHLSRSLQATPEKRRDASRDRDGTAAQPRRRRNTRRSLSLPTGALSYGDVKITYRDGHFVTEPVGEGCEGAHRKERAGDDRARLGSGAAVLCGSLMNIGSEEEMREEILSLLERGFSTEDITLLFSRYLDQNSNHLAESSAALQQSTQSLTAAGLYSTHSLPRQRRRPRDSLNRPVSVDDVHLWQQLSQSDQSLVSSEDGEDWAMKRTESFYRAMASSVVPRRAGGAGGEVRVRRRVREEEEEEVVVEEEGASGARLHRNNSDEARTDRSRSHRPGFIQRMLQKRKSFHDKPSSNGRTPKEDAPAAGQRKDARDAVSKKVSIKGIFRRKNSSSNAEWKRDSEDPGSPPIATFLNDDDIGAISSVPGSPTSGKTGRRTPSDPQLGQQSGSSGKISHPGGPSGLCSNSDDVDASLSSGVVLRREPLPLPGGVGGGGGGGGGGQRVSERYSGEYSYCEFDMESECRSSLDTLTPRSASPSGASSTLTLEEGEAGHLNRTLDMDSTLLASPGSLDETRVCADRTPVTSGGLAPGAGVDRTPVKSGLAPRPGRKPSLPKPDVDKLSTIVQGEITSSNSNDSGIQHDVTVDSNESLKVSSVCVMWFVGLYITICVRLRID